MPIRCRRRCAKMLTLELFLMRNPASTMPTLDETDRSDDARQHAPERRARAIRDLQRLWPSYRGQCRRLADDAPVPSLGARRYMMASAATHRPLCCLASRGGLGLLAACRQLDYFPAPKLTVCGLWLLRRVKQSPRG